MKKALLSIIIPVLIVGACSRNEDNNELAASSVEPIAKQELEVVISKAKAGDLEAINRLLKSSGGGDPDYIYWMQRAIDQGDKKWMKIKAGDLFGQALGENGSLRVVMLTQAQCLISLAGEWNADDPYYVQESIYERFPDYKFDPAVKMTKSCEFIDPTFNPKIYSYEFRDQQ